MISMDKQYRTRDGREVRIYAVDGGLMGDLVHGAVLSFFAGNGGVVKPFWQALHWQSDGKHNQIGESNNDLIEVKPRIQREYWVNVYKGHVELFEKNETANDFVNKDRIACVKIVIDCEEGEGL